MAAALVDDLTDLRLTLHRNAYRPVPVLGPHVTTKAAGKRPAMKSWEAVCATADEAEITCWTNAQRNCTNTGLLCGKLVGIDVPDRDQASRLAGNDPCPAPYGMALQFRAKNDLKRLMRKQNR